MTKYVYWQSEPRLWTAGYIAAGGMGPERDQHPESDHSSADQAAARVRWLNGGTDENIHELRDRINYVRRMAAAFDTPRDPDRVAAFIDDIKTVLGEG